MGFGGTIEGVVGRIRDVEIGRHRLPLPVCNFQELIQMSDSSFINGRNGLLGSEILSRFNMIIDFNKEKLYLQPNRYFPVAFSYDRSGITLIASGVDLKKFLVQDVLENSPAYEAGVRSGDEITKINDFPSRFFTLSAINSKLQAKVGKTVRLTLRRNGEKIKVQLKLRELI